MTDPNTHPYPFSLEEITDPGLYLGKEHVLELLHTPQGREIEANPTLIGHVWNLCVDTAPYTLIWTRSGPPHREASVRPYDLLDIVDRTELDDWPPFVPKFSIMDKRLKELNQRAIRVGSLIAQGHALEGIPTSRVKQNLAVITLGQLLADQVK